MATNLAYVAAAWCGFAMTLPTARVIAVTIAIVQAVFALLFLWPEFRSHFLRSPTRTAWPLQLTHACRFGAAATFAAFNAYLLAALALATAGTVVAMHSLRAKAERMAEQSV